MTVYTLIHYPKKGRNIYVQACAHYDEIVSETDDTITLKDIDSEHTTTIKKSDILTIEKD